MIRDQIVKKYSLHTLAQMLLQQEDLDLAKNVKIASKENPVTTDHMHTSGGPKRFDCCRCGGTDGHRQGEYGALKSTCNNCKKVGDPQGVYRSKPKTTVKSATVIEKSNMKRIV